MKTIKPKKLSKGDTVGFLGMSGSVREYPRLLDAKSYFEEKGYNVVISETCQQHHRYMAGNSDEACVNALNDFFSDENIDAIICARGGYGTLRLLKQLDYELIKNNPKIFAGYSDITIPLNMIYLKTGLITFHSAMPNGDFSFEINKYTEKSFFDTLSGKKKEYFTQDGNCYSKGTVNGKLWGGNLATLVSLCGTDFIPDEDLILFLEDLNEPVYKIDRMLTQLFNIDKLRQNVKGIAFGEFKDINDVDVLREIKHEIAQGLKIPVADGFKITHGKTKDTLPVGALCEYNSEQGLITVIEDYVL